MRLPVLAINGPTASGKTAVAVEVAGRIGRLGLAAEVVNADSMLVYRGMDIGTAKPTQQERGGVPHHLIDLWEVTHTATVAEFQPLARERIADCLDRVLPILVGGSALYVRSILDEFDFPGTDPALRARLEDDLAATGPHELHRRLAAVAPEAAAGILPGNGRRIVRALEVVELTGSFRSVLPTGRYAVGEVVEVGLDLDCDELDRRIEARVERMWAQGLVEEVRGLIPLRLRRGRTASRAIGYRQVLALLDGETDEAQARTATAAATRRFARKQLGWFRREPRIDWVPAGPDAAAAVVEAVRGRLDQTARQEV